MDAGNDITIRISPNEGTLVRSSICAVYARTPEPISDGCLIGMAGASDQKDLAKGGKQGRAAKSPALPLTSGTVTDRKFQTGVTYPHLFCQMKYFAALSSRTFSRRSVSVFRNTVSHENEPRLAQRICVV